jgi:tetratricopeptide (TPR) repeat protein
MRNLYIVFLLFWLFTGCEKKDLWKEKVEKGDYYFVNRNIDMALKYWTESLQIKKDPLTYEKIVVSLIIKNKLNEAKKYALSGLTCFNDYDNLLFNLGLIEFYLGEYEEAMKKLDNLLVKNKYYPNAHYLKGLIYEKLGKFYEAKKEFIEEINVNPGSRKSWEKLREMKNEK